VTFVFSLSAGNRAGQKARHEKRVKLFQLNPLIFLVGMRGFEPPVSASRTQRSTSLSHIPIEEMLSSQDDFGWQGLFLYFLVLSASCFSTNKTDK
jgi:ribosomal protein L15